MALQARRVREAERLARIKDPKLYKKVDTDALAEQIATKKAMKEAEVAYNAAADQQRLLIDQQLVYLEQERLRAEREKAVAMDDFRQTLQVRPHSARSSRTMPFQCPPNARPVRWPPPQPSRPQPQGKTLTREYDLYDPNALRREQPARVSDDDARLGASSLQKFHGEDLSHSHRVKMQQHELRQWCAEQTEAKQRVQAEAAREDTEFNSSMMEIDMLKTHLEASARSARSSTTTAVAEYNLAQAAAKKERERAAKIAEMQDNIEEIQNNLASTVLTEDPSIGHSFIAPNRLRPDHYKGMSVGEQQSILAEQAAQRAAKMEVEARKKAFSKSQDEELEYLRLVRCATEAQVNIKRAEMRKLVMEENKLLAEQQMATKTFLDKVIYPNKVEEHYFNQFNTTSR